MSALPLAPSLLRFWREKSRAEIIAWVLWGAATVHLAFMRPPGTLIPGERSQLLGGILCALSLGAACFVKGKLKEAGSRAEVAVSLALALLLVLSGLFSLTPLSSSFRGFVILASSLGGFWCARLLLSTGPARILFLELSLILLTGILVVGLASHFLTGEVHQLLDANHHPVASRILLLWWAPLALLFTPAAGLGPRLGSWLLLAASYLVLYLNVLRSTLVIPLIMAGEAALFRVWRWRYVLLAAVPILGLTAYLAAHVPHFRKGPGSESFYYRVENYRFSLHIALKHPLLGIGLRAPREEFLTDYDKKYPYVSREQFAHSVERIRTSENVFLTFLAEAGFPFTLIYILALIILLTRLARLARAPDPAGAIPPLALLLPLTGALLHFQLLDGLFHPQISWFFHLLLGMIRPEKESLPDDLPRN
jgi:hypothetical protein